MKDILSYDQKADLLYKWATDSLDKTEREVLETWASGNPKRQKYLQQLRDPQFLEQEYHQLKATDSRSAMAEMQARIDRYRLSSRLRIAGRRWIARAAAVAVIAVAGATIWYHQYTKVTPPVLSQEIQQAMQVSDNVVLMKVYKNFPAIVDQLKEHDMLRHAVLVSRAGLDGECVIDDLEAQRGKKLNYLSTILTRRAEVGAEEKGSGAR